MQLNLNNIRSSKFVDLSEPEILDIVIEALKIAKYEFTNNHHLNVSFVNHACLLIKTKSISLVTDPWIIGSAFSTGWFLKYQTKEMTNTEES